MTTEDALKEIEKLVAPHVWPLARAVSIEAFKTGESPDDWVEGAARDVHKWGDSNATCWEELAQDYGVEITDAVDPEDVRVRLSAARKS